MKWEYCIKMFDLDKWNKLGAEGWELVAIEQYQRSEYRGGGMETYGYFKRVYESSLPDAPPK